MVEILIFDDDILISRPKRTVRPAVGLAPPPLSPCDPRISHALRDKFNSRSESLRETFPGIQNNHVYRSPRERVKRTGTAILCKYRINKTELDY